MKRVERSLPESITLVYSDKEFSLPTHIAQERSPVLSDLISDSTDGEYRIPLPVDGIEYLIDYLLTCNFPMDSYSFIYLIHYLNIDFPLTRELLITWIWNKRKDFDGFNPDERIVLESGGFYYVIPPRAPSLSLKRIFFETIFPFLEISLLAKLACGSTEIYSTVFEYMCGYAKEHVPALCNAEPIQAVRALRYLYYNKGVWFSTKGLALKMFPDTTGFKRLDSRGYSLESVIIASALCNSLHMTGFSGKTPIEPRLHAIRDAFKAIYAHRNGYKVLDVGVIGCGYENVADAYQLAIKHAKEDNDFTKLYRIYPLEKFQEYVNSLKE